MDHAPSASRVWSWCHATGRSGAAPSRARSATTAPRLRTGRAASPTRRRSARGRWDRAARRRPPPSRTPPLPGRRPRGARASAAARRRCGALVERPRFEGGLRGALREREADRVLVEATRTLQVDGSQHVAAEHPPSLPRRRRLERVRPSAATAPGSAPRRAVAPLRGGSRRRAPAVQDVEQSLALDGLREEVVASRLERLVAVFGHRLRGERDDR